jgi:hypothetical protein
MVMKYIKTTVLTLFLGLSISFIQAQITKPKYQKPKFNPTFQLGTATPFDEIMNALNKGKCYKIAVVSLQLNKKNIHENSYNVETHHGKGFIQKEGNDLKSVFPLLIGLKQTRYQKNRVNTTIKISKSGNGMRIDFRNENNYYLFYVDKIEKNKTGYFMITGQDKSSQTISFTIAIFETPCLI